MLFALPLLALAFCTGVGWLTWTRPAVMLQNFRLARMVVVFLFGVAFAFGAGVQATYHALLPYLDGDEIRQAAISMGFLRLMNPEWIGTAGLIILLVLHAMRALAAEIARPPRAGRS